jgi:hypothetical protein
LYTGFWLVDGVDGVDGVDVVVVLVPHCLTSSVVSGEILSTAFFTESNV